MLNVSKMTYPNKQDKVLELFFNEAAKHWHFSEIVKKSGISEQRANHWLKAFTRERLINRIKPKGKLPYYLADYDNPHYRNVKRIYALNKLQETGLLDRLQLLENAKAVVIFGSFSRSDWHTDSDIDIFVYGEPGDLKFGTRVLGREVQVHTCKTKKDIKEIRSGLMRNVINGYFVKGQVHDLVEVMV